MMDNNCWFLSMILVLGHCIITIAEDTFCETKGCTDAANTIMKNMDTTANPCDDFYQFACGGLLNNTKFPEGEDEVSTITQINEHLELQLKNLLEEEIKKDDLNAFKNIKKFYSSCMNQTEIEKGAIDSLKVLLEKVGGWPLLDKTWTKKKGPWSTIVELRKLGFYSDYLLEFAILPDAQNLSQNLMVLKVPNFGLDNKYLANDSDPINKAYLNLMQQSAVLLGAEQEMAKKEMNEVFDFQKKLYEISKKRVSGTRVTIGNLSTLEPCIDWKKLISGMINDDKVKVSEEDTIFVRSPDYIKNLSNLIKNTTDRVLFNYIIWRGVQDSMIYLNNEAYFDYYDLYSLIHPTVKNETERWKICTYTTKSVLDFGLGSMYIRKYFSGNISLLARALVDDLKQSFNETFSNVNWMDPETKRRAISKLKAMSVHIGFSSELLNDTLLEGYYRDLHLNSHNYYNNIRNLTLFDKNMYFSKYGQLVNQRESTSYKDPIEVNAVNNFLENAIYFPAALMQYTYFAYDRPNYLNYGGFGYVAGHEIGHAYDSTGILFNETGGFENWWNETSALLLENRENCLIYQYGNYTIPQTNISWDSSNTLNEDMCDNIGIKMAYRAYAKSIANKAKKEDLLKGLNYTQAQLFWITSANTLCGNIRPQVLEKHIEEDEHSPYMFRVIGSFSNSPEFAKDFNCSQDSKMNPEDKCELY